MFYNTHASGVMAKQKPTILKPFEYYDHLPHLEIFVTRANVSRIASIKFSSIYKKKVSRIAYIAILLKLVQHGASGTNRPVHTMQAEKN